MSKYLRDHIKAVLFDHDDTLVGTIEAKSAQHKHIAKVLYGKDLSDEEIRQHWGKPLTTIMSLLYGVEDISEAMELMMQLHADFPKVIFEDTVATLESLKKQEVKIGIVTSSMRFSLEYDLSEMPELKKLLDYTQTQDDTDYHKPDPRVFEPAKRWLEKFEIKPGEVLYVGDGLLDMKAALGAGFEFIGVGTGIITPDEFASNGAKAIRTLAELVS